MPSTEQGHHAKRVYLHQDGRLVVPSSASILIEGTTNTRMNSGARILNRNIGLTTSRTTEVAGGNLSNDGHTIIVTTAVGTLKLAAPVKGVEKILTWASTASAKVKVRVVATVDEATPLIKVGALGGKVNPTLGATVIYASSDALKYAKTNKYGGWPTITLVGFSTSRWVVKSVFPQPTTDVKQFFFATST